MNKITEKIIEPSQIYTGNTFLLKIKAIRYLTYLEAKNLFTYNTIERYTYGEMKGE